MRIYFDESGNTGCVISENELLNFRTQPTFSLGAIVTKDDEDETRLRRKYERFKEKYGIQGEIKGSELLTKNCNSELSYFMRYVLDNTHFYTIIYDKRFYLSTLLLLALVGREFRDTLTLQFYQIASELSLQEDVFFYKYLEYVQNVSEENFISYLNYLCGFDYKNMEDENPIIIIAKKLLENDNPKYFYDDFLTYGWYTDEKQTNVINVNALAELIYFIKNDLHVENKDLVYVHDEQKQFKGTIKDELLQCGIEVKFSESIDDIFIQMADNVASISRHAFDKMRYHFRKKEQWEIRSEWDLKLFAKVSKRMTNRHIKYTVPLCDWSLACLL